MSEAAQQLLPALLALPAADRVVLLDALRSSLPDPDEGEMSAEFDAELDRRRAEHENGAEPGVLASDFFRQLREARK